MAKTQKNSFKISEPDFSSEEEGASKSNLHHLHAPKDLEFIPAEIDKGKVMLMLKEGNAEERVRAARLIGDYVLARKEKMPEAVYPLCRLLKNDDNVNVREEVAWALWKLGDTRCADSLFYALSKDPSVDVREKAARALGLLGIRKAAPVMIALLSMGKQISTKLRAALAASLGLLADERSVKVMLEAAQDAEPAVRYEAVKSLGRFLVSFPPEISEAAFGQIEKSINPRRERVAAIRRSAVRALRMGSDLRAAKAVAKAAVSDPDGETRRQAVEALMCFSGPEVESALLEALEDSDWEVRKTAGRVLAEFAKRSIVYNIPRVCEALIRMERMFPSGSREWRIAALAFANL
jgi:HEAT repeat protein